MNPTTPPASLPSPAPAGRRTNVLEWAAAVALTVAAAMLTGFLVYGFYGAADAPHYINIALRVKDVQLPFASRQLGPLVADALAHLLSVSILHAFLIQGIASLVILSGIVYKLFQSNGAPRWLLLLFVPLPFWALLVGGMVLPDLWYAALAALLCWLLGRRLHLAAALMFFPMMLSRETTLLVLVWFLVTNYRHRLGWRPAAAAIGCCVVAALVVKRLTAASAGNHEHIPAVVYLVAKIPWNFSRYVLGVVPWSNVYPELCPVPAFQTSLHLGPVTAVGICGFDRLAPFFLVNRVLRVFGLLPLLLLVAWRRRAAPALTNPLITFALLYGVFCYVTGPVLGTGLDRLAAYGWPAFLVALPQLLSKVPPSLHPGAELNWGLSFLTLHLLSCAVAYWDSIAGAAVLQLLLFLLGWIALERWWRPADSDRASRAAQRDATSTPITVP